MSKYIFGGSPYSIVEWKQIDMFFCSGLVLYQQHSAEYFQFRENSEQVEFGK